MKSMTSKVAPLVATLFIAFAVASLHAADGVLIVEHVTSGGNTRTTEMQIEKTRMRIDLGGKQFLIFDGAKQVLDLINVDKKTYIEMTKADLERLASQMQGATARMQAQLEKMPPAQRKQMETLMKDRGMGAVAKTEYKRAGSGQVGKWSCDRYEGFQNGTKISELCTVDPRVLGLAATDFAVADQAAAFFKTALPQGNSQFFGIGKIEDQGFSGFPVRSVFTVAGQQTTTELSEVGRQAFADALFAVPAGYTKQPPIGGRGRGGRLDRERRPYSDPSPLVTSTYRSPSSYPTRTCHGLQQTSQSCTSVPITSGSR